MPRGHHQQMLTDGGKYPLGDKTRAKRMSRVLGRVAASLLQAVGLPELITHSLEEYQAQAIHLATTPAELRSLRTKLAYNRTRMPLFDTSRFTRHLEEAYRLMWDRHARGLPPTLLRVTPLPSDT